VVRSRNVFLDCVDIELYTGLGDIPIDLHDNYDMTINKANTVVSIYLT
jgi:hypothetical protein